MAQDTLTRWFSVIDIAVANGPGYTDQMVQRYIDIAGANGPEYTDPDGSALYYIIDIAGPIGPEYTDPDGSAP